MSSGSDLPASRHADADPDAIAAIFARADDEESRILTELNPTYTAASVAPLEPARHPVQRPRPTAPLREAAHEPAPGLEVTPVDPTPGNGPRHALPAQEEIDALFMRSEAQTQGIIAALRTESTATQSDSDLIR